jgi:hypothetical protein
MVPEIIRGICLLALDTSHEPPVLYVTSSI